MLDVSLLKMGKYVSTNNQFEKFKIPDFEYISVYIIEAKHFVYIFHYATNTSRKHTFGIKRN